MSDYFPTVEAFDAARAERAADVEGDGASVEYEYHDDADDPYAVSGDIGDGYGEPDPLSAGFVPEEFEPAANPWASQGGREVLNEAVTAECDRLGVPAEARSGVLRHAGELFQAWFADPTFGDQVEELIAQHGGDKGLALEEMAALAFQSAALEQRVRSGGGSYQDVIDLHGLAGAPKNPERPHFSTYEEAMAAWDRVARSGPEAVL